MKKFKLNKRELAYCYWRARDNTMEEAMPKAGYKCRGDNARSWGSRLEKKPNIQEEIQKEKLNIFDKSCITVEYVLGNLKHLAEVARNEADKIRATELLGKYLAMFTEKQEVTTIDKQDNQFSLDRLAKIKSASEN